MPETAVTLPVAARELGVSVPALRREIARGAPVARRGGRGRGRATLVDVAAVRAWRGSEAVSERAAMLLRRGCAVEAIDQVLADALCEAFHDGSLTAFGLKPWQAARALGFGWYVATRAIRDHLQREDCALPALMVPEKIDALREF